MSYTHLARGSNPLAPTEKSLIFQCIGNEIPEQPQVYLDLILIRICYNISCPMKRVLFLLFLIGFLIVSIVRLDSVMADDNQCQTTNDPTVLGKCVDDLSSQLNSSVKATAPLEDQVKNLQTQLTGIVNRVTAIEQDLVAKKKIIDAGYKDLARDKDIFDKTVRNYYIKSYVFSPLLVFLSSADAASATRLLVYQQKGTDADKNTITNIALKITDLETQQKALQSEEDALAAVKVKIEPEKVQLDKVIAGAKAYQATLTHQIADLSAKQQQILSQRLASLNIPLSAYAGIGGGCSSDLTNGKSPGFSPRIGFFTYGVPNRVGLNQYGAKGRADAGQNYTQILNAYYNADISTGQSTSTNIHVTGSNEYGQSFDTNWSIEDYVKHVYEMPTTWNAEALKSQAIAARSYALAYTNNGAGSICPSQSCQVVKQELNSQAWVDAVNATSGIVLMSGGQPIKAWFSSTHGGYVHSSGDIGWSATSYTKTAQDTTSNVSSFSDLQNNAYDKSSPWFYCDWGSRSSYGGTAWLQPSEVADIANVILLAKADSSTGNHLYQPDKPNPEGTDTWDPDRVRQELKNHGITGYTSVSDVSVSVDFGGGKTTSVSVTGDGTSQSFDAGEFKNWFNLRAPASIQIVGPLFNVEKQ